MTTTTLFDVNVWKPELEQLEEVIKKNDACSIRARWHSGNKLLALRKGKQLPKKVLEILVHDFQVSRSELSARMKFATKFQSEAELSNVIESHRTWYPIKQHALTNKPREKKDKPAVSTLKRALELLEKFDPATADPDDVFMLDVLESCIRRWKESVAALSEHLEARRQRSKAALDAREAALEARTQSLKAAADAQVANDIEYLPDEEGDDPFSASEEEDSATA
jgi:hypothetical protein